jgi:oxalate decarboxylase/phosphoglucose isomerase-like protein (cupin superfamily)
MHGEGSVTVAANPRATPETAPIREGDAVPLLLGDVHAFANTSNQPLEFLIVGVSRDSNHGIDNVDVDLRPGR